MQSFRPTPDESWEELVRGCRRLVSPLRFQSVRAKRHMLGSRPALCRNVCEVSRPQPSPTDGFLEVPRVLEESRVTNTAPKPKTGGHTVAIPIANDCCKTNLQNNLSRILVDFCLLSSEKVTIFHNGASTSSPFLGGYQRKFGRVWSCFLRWRGIG